MIKKLRMKFIFISMAGILSVLLIMFAAQNYILERDSRAQTQRVLETVVQLNGALYPFQDYHFDTVIKWSGEEGEPALEIARATKFFYVCLDVYGREIYSNMTAMNEMNQNDAVQLARQALETKQESGDIGEYQYLVAKRYYGWTVAMAQRGIEKHMLERLNTVSLISVFTGLVVFLILVLIFTQWAIKPIQRAFDNQKRFVSDASHELKTPITVVAANVDVLRNEIGENKWLSYINNQNERMGTLVNELLMLARADEGRQRVVFSLFDLSAMMTDCALEFECMAYEQNKSFEIDIQPGIRCRGDAQLLRQLCAIFIDNAIKHSDPSGSIFIQLKANGSRAEMFFCNTGEPIKESEKARIFERFYRSDDSRCRETGGYGLGLSIAKYIADIHKAKIQIRNSKENQVIFFVSLPIG